MEVILKQDIANLGNRDEIVKVKNGYGSNSLIPRGYAIPANESNRKVLQETLKQRAHKEEKIRKDAESLAENLVKAGIEVGAKVGESGKIFGSVNAIQLADALKKKGYDVDRKQISLDTESIKTLGTYTAHIKIYKDIKVDIEFDVVAE